MKSRIFFGFMPSSGRRTKDPFIPRFSHHSPIHLDNQRQAYVNPEYLRTFHNSRLCLAGVFTSVQLTESDVDAELAAAIACRAES